VVVDAVVVMPVLLVAVAVDVGAEVVAVGVVGGPLNREGLRPDVIPTVEIEYTF
jgi:hypothetical protein